jgi:hypothetical protein
MPQKPSKEQFYRGRSIVGVEWWLSECSLPQLAWARLRVLDDGTADACFGMGETLYGFADRRHASYFLLEDEYISLVGIDQEDEREHGVRAAEITPPTWEDRESQNFEYLGTY